MWVGGAGRPESACEVLSSRAASLDQPCRDARAAAVQDAGKHSSSGSGLMLMIDVSRAAVSDELRSSCSAIGTCSRTRVVVCGTKSGRTASGGKTLAIPAAQAHSRVTAAPDVQDASGAYRAVKSIVEFNLSRPRTFFGEA